MNCEKTWKECLQSLFEPVHSLQQQQRNSLPVSSPQLQRRPVRRRRELVSLRVRSGIRRTGLPHQWVAWELAEGEGSVGGRGRGWKAAVGKREPIVSGRQIRKPFRKTGLTSRLSAEPRPVRRLGALSRGPLGEKPSRKTFSGPECYPIEAFHTDPL